MSRERERGGYTQGDLGRVLAVLQARSVPAKINKLINNILFSLKAMAVTDLPLSFSQFWPGVSSRFGSTSRLSRVFSVALWLLVSVVSLVKYHDLCAVRRVPVPCVCALIWMSLRTRFCAVLFYLKIIFLFKKNRPLPKPKSHWVI